MSDNQTIYEVIRDIGYAIMRMEHDKILAVSVVKDSDKFYSWRASNGNDFGMSETAHAIEKAFTVTRNIPDPRDEKIKDLEFQLGQIRISLDHKTTLLASCEKSLEERDAKLYALKA